MFTTASLKAGMVATTASSLTSTASAAAALGSSGAALEALFELTEAKPVAHLAHVLASELTEVRMRAYRCEHITTLSPPQRRRVSRFQLVSFGCLKTDTQCILVG